jgi:hypothetical protein
MAALEVTDALVERLPARSEEIRRRLALDPEFRTVCADYHDVLEALARLEAASPRDSARVEQYEKLAAELMAEAVEMIRGGPT